MPSRNAPFPQLYSILRELKATLIGTCDDDGSRPRVAVDEHEHHKHVPIWKVGDSTAALNMSKGTRENICNKVSRPECPCGEPDSDPAEEYISKALGSVTTRKWKTSSRSLRAYSPNTDVRGWGVSDPPGDKGILSMNSSHSVIVSKLMDCLQASYAYPHRSSIPPSKHPAARTPRAFSGRIRLMETEE